MFPSRAVRVSAATVTCLVFALWTAHAAQAEDPADQAARRLKAVLNTAGLEEVGKTQYVLVFAKTDFLKDATSKELMTAVNTAYETLRKRFGYDGDQNRFATMFDAEAMSRRKHIVPTPAVLIVGDETTVSAAGQACVNEANALSILKVIMPGGAFGIPQKHALWHEFSHWTYRHAVTSGQPAWLNEGLAEYFAVKETTDKPEDNSVFNDMVKRLAEASKNGKVWDASLLDAPGLASLSREQSDTAWLLVKLLMDAEPKLVDTLFGAAFTLESFAVTVGEGVVKDIVGSVSRMAKEGLPEAKASMLLQQAIAWLAEGKKPAKTMMVSMKPLTCRFKLKAKVKTEPRERSATNPSTSAVDANDYFLEGEVSSLLADTVSLTVKASNADGHDVWSNEVTAMSESVAPKEKKEFRRQIEVSESARTLRVSLYWTSGNGGKYVRRYECGMWASVREE